MHNSRMIGNVTADGVLREQHAVLKSLDGFRVRGVFNSPGAIRKLIVFIHGLIGEKDNHLYDKGARSLPVSDVDTFRCDLFSNESYRRKLADCSLINFNQGLLLGLEHFASRCDEIHVVGRRIGGYVAMNADQAHVTSLIRWGAGLQNAPTNFGPFTYHEELSSYLVKLKISYLVLVGLVNERTQQGAGTVRKIQRAVTLVFARNTAIRETWKPNLQRIKTPHDSVTINEAGHGFNELGKNELLLEETLSWVQKKQDQYSVKKTITER